MISIPLSLLILASALCLSLVEAVWSTLYTEDNLNAYVHLTNNSLLFVGPATQAPLSMKELATPPTDSTLAITTNDTLLAFHGSSFCEPLSVSVYSPEQDTWTTLPRGSEEFQPPNFMEYSQYLSSPSSPNIYIYGGRNLTNSCANTVPDPSYSSSDSWASTWGLDDYIYVSRDIYEFNVENNTYRNLSAMIAPTEMFGTGVLRSANLSWILIGGKTSRGWVGSNQLASVSMAAESWSFTSTSTNNYKRVDSRTGPLLLPLRTPLNSNKMSSDTTDLVYTDDANSSSVNNVMVIGGTVNGHSSLPFVTGISSLTTTGWTWSDAVSQEFLNETTFLGGVAFGNILITFSKKATSSWAYKRASGTLDNFNVQYIDTQNWSVISAYNPDTLQQGFSLSESSDGTGGNSGNSNGVGSANTAATAGTAATAPATNGNTLNIINTATAGSPATKSLPTLAASASPVTTGTATNTNNGMPALPVLSTSTPGTTAQAETTNTSPTLGTSTVSSSSTTAKDTKSTTNTESPTPKSPTPNSPTGATNPADTATAGAGTPETTKGTATATHGAQSSATAEAQDDSSNSQTSTTTKIALSTVLPVSFVIIASALVLLFYRRWKQKKEEDPSRSPFSPYLGPLMPSSTNTSRAMFNSLQYPDFHRSDSINSWAEKRLRYEMAVANQNGGAGAGAAGLGLAIHQESFQHSRTNSRAPAEFSHLAEDGTSSSGQTFGPEGVLLAPVSTRGSHNDTQMVNGSSNPFVGGAEYSFPPQGEIDRDEIMDAYLYDTREEPGSPGLNRHYSSLRSAQYGSRSARDSTIPIMEDDPDGTDYHSYITRAKRENAADAGPKRSPSFLQRVGSIISTISTIGGGDGKLFGRAPRRFSTYSLQHFHTIREDPQGSGLMPPPRPPVSPPGLRRHNRDRSTWGSSSMGSGQMSPQSPHHMHNTSRDYSEDFEGDSGGRGLGDNLLFQPEDLNSAQDTSLDGIVVGNGSAGQGDDEEDDEYGDDEDIFRGREVQVLVSSRRRTRLRVTNPDPATPSRTNSDKSTDSEKPAVVSRAASILSKANKMDNDDDDDNTLHVRKTRTTAGDAGFSPAAVVKKMTSSGSLASLILGRQPSRAFSSRKEKLDDPEEEQEDDITNTKIHPRAVSSGSVFGNH